MGRLCLLIITGLLLVACGDDDSSKVDGAACTPTTCAAQGKNCGEIPNGCGGTLPCGDCTGIDSCGGGGTANVCGAGTCTPTTCLAEGKDCGVISDGCAATLPCGDCAGTCTDNVCILATIDAAPGPDVPESTQHGQCSNACMSNPGAECCKTCGCSAGAPCYPVCGSGYEWDCEMMCCFSYTTYECEAGTGS
jgi:hypothetical protein